MEPFKLNQELTFKDNSKWIVKKIFDTKLVKDKLYQSMRKAFNKGARYEITLQGNNGNIMMSDLRIKEVLK